MCYFSFIFDYQGVRSVWSLRKSNKSAHSLAKANGRRTNKAALAVGETTLCATAAIWRRGFTQRQDHWHFEECAWRAMRHGKSRRIPLEYLRD